MVVMLEYQLSNLTCVGRVWCLSRSHTWYCSCSIATSWRLNCVQNVHPWLKCSSGSGLRRCGSRKCDRSVIQQCTVGLQHHDMLHVIAAIYELLKIRYNCCRYFFLFKYSTWTSNLLYRNFDFEARMSGWSIQLFPDEHPKSLLVRSFSKHRYDNSSKCRFSSWDHSYI